MPGKTEAVLAVFFVLVLVSCGKEGRFENPDPFKERPKQSFVKPSPVASSANPKVSSGPKDGPYCHHDSAGKYPDTFILVSKGMKGDHAFADGGGCILKPIREVWATSHNPDAWRWKKSDMSNFRLLPDAAVAFHFSADYEAGPWPFTQQWVIEYRQSVVAGSVEKPEQILIQYKKVSGTSYISYWAGDIELQSLARGVTSFAMHNEVQAAQTGIDEAAGGVHDVADKMHELPPVWDYLKKPSELETLLQNFQN